MRPYRTGHPPEFLVAQMNFQFLGVLRLSNCQVELADRAKRASRANESLVSLLLTGYLRIILISHYPIDRGATVPRISQNESIR